MSSQQPITTIPTQQDGAASAPTGEIELLRFYLIVRQHRRLIATVTLLGTVTAAIVAFILPNEYASTVNAVPPKRPQTGIESVLGGISTALRDIGLTRLAQGRTPAMGYDFTAILRSRSLLDSLIERFDLVNVYQITDTDSPDSARALARKELEDRYEFELDGAGNYLITIVDRDRYRAAAMANAAVEIANNIARELDRQESEVLLRGLQQRLEETLARMAAAADSLAAVGKKTMMFAPLEQAQAAASAIAEAKAQLMSQEILLSILNERYGANDPATEQQQRLVESLRQKVNDMERRPGFVGNFALPDAPKAAYDYMRYYTELETMMKLKAALQPLLDDLRSSLTRYSPSLYVVDAAIPAYKKDRPHRTLIIAGGGISSMIVGIVLAMLIDLYQKIRSRLDGVSSTTR